MSESLQDKQPTITPEMFEAYQRQQRAEEQATEQAAMQQCINDLQTLAAERGFMIGAVPQLTPDGRTVASWGVQRKQQ